MNEFRFLDWDVYKDAKLIVKRIHSLTRKFPSDFKYDLGSQINRSSISIVLNIAEGSGKHSDPELNRFFSISNGSVNETIAGLDIAYDNRLISNKDFQELINDLKSISRQLGGFRKKLLRKS